MLTVKVVIGEDRVNRVIDIKKARFSKMKNGLERNQQITIRVSMPPQVQPDLFAKHDKQWLLRKAYPMP